MLCAPTLNFKSGLTYVRPEWCIESVAISIEKHERSGVGRWLNDVFYGLFPKDLSSHGIVLMSSINAAHLRDITDESTPTDHALYHKRIERTELQTISSFKVRQRARLQGCTPPTFPYPGRNPVTARVPMQIVHAHLQAMLCDLVASIDGCAPMHMVPALIRPAVSCS